MLTSALVLATLAFTPAAAPDDAKDAPAAEPDAGEEWAPTSPNFSDYVSEDAPFYAPMLYFMPYKLPDNLEPDVDDDLLLIWGLQAVLGFFNYSIVGIFVPYFLGPEKVDATYFGEIIVASAVEGLVLTLIRGLAAIVCLAVPILGWALFIPVQIALHFVTVLYFDPLVHTVVYDRALKRKRAHPDDVPPASATPPAAEPKKDARWLQMQQRHLALSY